MKITGKQLLGVIDKPKETIRAVLAQNKRSMEEELPDQLILFEGYYFGSS